LERYCQYMEIGNSFWELEDDCTLKDGVDIDILYRNIGDFSQMLYAVIEEHTAYNGYTTCMWHNLLNCKILYDKNDRLRAAQEKYNVPYPKELKRAIIDRQMRLLDSALPAYRTQIKKAVRRGDLVSINHRVTEFLASYFDLLFALNEQTHPGEKRLIELCKKNCGILPEDFEEKIQMLFSHMYAKGGERLKVIDDVDRIIGCVRRMQVIF